MTEKLISPGSTFFESTGQVSNIRGALTGVGWFLGIAEQGEVDVPQEVVNFSDFRRKFGGFMSSYYLAKDVDAFFKEGGQKAYVSRTCHHTANVADAVKASLTVQGFNDGEESRTKVDTLKIEANGQGLYGNNFNISTKKAGTTLSVLIGTGAVTSATLTDVTDISIGDIVDIYDATIWVRVIVTAISGLVIYFKEITFATGIATTSSVAETADVHAVRTILTSDLISNAVSMALSNINGINVGMVLTIVDTQVGAPNHVNVKVTGISGSTVTFADIGTITTIAVANSEVVSHGFNINIFDGAVQVPTTLNFLTMVNENEKDYIENKPTNDYVAFSDLNSTESDIGDFPAVLSNTYLTGGDDGLVGLTDADFSGDKGSKTGIYAFDAVNDMFAQFGCPDQRSAAFQTNMKNYMESRSLFGEFDVDFGKTPEEAKDYKLNTLALNTTYGEMNHPNVKWQNPETAIVSDIPQSGATMGLNARAWSKINGGPWIAAAGTEDGVFRSIQGFESNVYDDKDYRDLVYPAGINPLYRYPSIGNVKWGIRLPALNDSNFSQVPERVTFLYCEHSVINGTPWIVFKNIDTTNLGRLKRTVTKFLRGVWGQGGLKGLTEAEAFIVDVSSDVNTKVRNDAGEMWCKVGLATKKAGEFVYFEFGKKIEVGG